MRTRAKEQRNEASLKSQLVQRTVETNALKKTAETHQTQLAELAVRESALNQQLVDQTEHFRGQEERFKAEIDEAEAAATQTAAQHRQTLEGARSSKHHN
jgi:hypothetical protein